MESTTDVIADLAAAFPHRPITRETLAVYVKHLRDLPPNELADAVTRLIRTSEFMPTVHAIREAVAENRLQLPTEAEALAEVDALAAMREPLPRDDPRRTKMHPLVREALEAVGGYYGYRAAGEPSVIRGQFLRIYKDLRHSRVADVVVGDIALARGEPQRELTA